MERDNEAQSESRRIIGRVGPESGATMMARAKNHMAGRDADEKDWAELWGTRVGRWLGAALLIYLLWWLYNFVASGG